VQNENFNLYNAATIPHVLRSRSSIYFLYGGLFRDLSEVRAKLGSKNPSLHNTKFSHDDTVRIESPRIW